MAGKKACATKRESTSKSAAPTAKRSKKDDSSVKIVDRVTPDKSPNDPNEYRVIRLSNGLTVVLISRRNPAPSKKPDGISSQLACPFPPIDEMGLEEPECCFLPDEGFHSSYHQYQLEPFPTANHRLCEDFDRGFNASNGAASNKRCHTSVAVVVNGGSLNDPVDCQGLAHFTEHMVHLGSKKFPGENSIDLLLSNFGFHNATTYQHLTSYYNEVPDDLLQWNLEMFSEMLTNPLFNLDVLSREVNAVDNEFYYRLPSRHRMLLLPHVAIQTPDHPLERFGCGNKTTLTNCVGQDGKRIQCAMKNNHNQKYVASAMTLSINSTKSLADLEKITLTHFSKLPHGTHQVLHKRVGEAASQQLILQNTNNSHIYIQGDSSAAELTLIWMLPASLWLNNRQERVVEVMESLLRDTSENSLDAYFRREGLAWKMEVGAISTHYATMFATIIHLTEIGRQQIGQIVEAIFSFINTLRNGTSEQEMRRRFEELKIANLRGFHYGEQGCSIESTKNFAMRLQYNDALKSVVNGESWVDAKFSHQGILNGLQQLLDPSRLVKMETIPKTMTLEDVRKREASLGRRAGNVERIPYSNAPYMIVKTEGASSCSNQGSFQAQFGMPPPNPFLKDECNKNCGENGSGDGGDFFLLRPQYFGSINPQRLKWKSKRDPCGNVVIPKISGIHYGNCAGSQDPYYCSATLNFISPFCHPRTSRTQALSWLWAVVIDDKVHGKVSEFSLGGYGFSVNPGMRIHVEGYPKHLDLVVEAIITKMFDKGISETDFKLAQQHLQVRRERILSCGNFISQVLVESIFQSHPPIDLLGEFEDLTLDDLRHFIAAFMQSTYCVVELRGNLPLTKFNCIAASLDKREFGPRLDYPSTARTQHAPPGTLVPGETCIRVKSLASFGFTTSVSNLYILGSYASKDNAFFCFAAAMLFMSSSAHMQLRTKDQLGYVVSARLINTRIKDQLMAFAVNVTSTAKKFSPCQLDNKIDQFLAKYGDILKEMDDEVFNIMKRKVRLPETLTQEEVGDWFNSFFGDEFLVPDHHLKCSMKGIRKVSVQVLTGNTAAEPFTCNCDKCKSIEWKKGDSHNSSLEFAGGTGDYRNYFVNAPSRF